MALSFASNGQFINGVYFGQQTPELLGTVTGKFTKLTNPALGSHFVGFQSGDDYVRIKAFYDTDFILGNNINFPNISRISYIQLGQVCINGIPIPIGDDDAQVFFEARNPVKITGNNEFNARADYWWIDAFIRAPHDILFPWKAAVNDPGLKERDLFFFPKEYGTFTGRSSGLRKNGEALCASLFEQSSLENVPVTEVPDDVREMANIINTEMPFEDEDLLVAMQAPALSLIFEFFSTIKNALKDHEVVPVPVYQFFGNFLLLRANYVDSAFGEQKEIIYPILASTNTGNISVKIHKITIPAGLPDQQVYELVNGYINQFGNSPVIAGTFPMKFNTVIQFFGALKQQFELNEVELAASYRIQPAGNILLIRNTFINTEEQIYIGRSDANNTDRLNFFYFDPEVYMDLAEEFMESNDDDPLNVSYWMGFTEIDPVFYTRDYTPSELLEFMRRRGMNLQIENQDWVMTYQYITALCLFNDSAKQLLIYDAFHWNFSRTIKADEDTWGAVQFDPDKNVSVAGNFHFLLKAYLDRIINDNSYQVLLNPFLRS